MDIDKRIAEIMLKKERLSEKHTLDTCGEFPPKWSEPLSEECVAAFENSHGIKFPEDYRRFITTVARGGTQPFYGLQSIDRKSEDDFGIYPLKNQKSGKAMRFLDRLEYFADKTYELDDDDYFNYGELATEYL